MANTVVYVENSKDNLTNIERFLKDSSCEKCLDMETRLQEALKELSSAHLIIGLLISEYKLSMAIEDDFINPTTSQARLDGEESINWKLITSRHTREQIRRNTKTKERDLTFQVNQKCVSINRYEALEAYNVTHRNDIDTNTITAYELTDINRSQNDKYNKSGKHNTPTKESLANSSKQPSAQHNLQNPEKNQNGQGMEEKKLSYPIPNIINGHLLSKEKGRSTTSREAVQDVSKMNSVKVCRKDTQKSEMDTVSCNKNLCKEKQGEHNIVILGDSHTRSLDGRKSHKILMIGDSHVRNYATKLQRNLGTNYEVSSFVKPGIGMDTIVNTARDEIKNLRSEDVMVI